jgi:hypothetical protein
MTAQPETRAAGRLTETERKILRDYRTQVPENTLRSIQRRFDRCFHQHISEFPRVG